MPEARDVDVEARVVPEFMVLEDALHAKVDRLKAEGFSAEERARLTAADRSAAARARGEAFKATQGRGKPMSYGHGSREKFLKETKG